MEQKFFVCLDTAWGGADIWLNEADFADYHADPQQFAADHFNLTKAEYADWVEGGATVQCIGTNAHGKRCKRRSKILGDEFAALRNHWRCHCHSN